MAHRRLIAGALTTALLLSMGATPALADDPTPTDSPSSSPSATPSDPSPEPTQSEPPAPGDAGSSPSPSPTATNPGPLPDWAVPCQYVGGGEGPDGYWYVQYPSTDWPGYCGAPEQWPIHFWWVIIDGQIKLFNRDPRFDPSVSAADAANAVPFGDPLPGALGSGLPSDASPEQVAATTAIINTISATDHRAANSAQVGHPSLGWTIGDTTLQPTAHEAGTGW